MIEILGLFASIALVFALALLVVPSIINLALRAWVALMDNREGEQ